MHAQYFKKLSKDKLVFYVCQHEKSIRMVYQSVDNRCLKPLLDKLSAKALKCMFVGHSNMQKGYKCYHPMTGKLLVTKDVIFDENQFFYSSEIRKLMRNMRNTRRQLEWKFQLPLTQLNREIQFNFLNNLKRA